MLLWVFVVSAEENQSLYNRCSQRITPTVLFAQRGPWPSLGRSGETSRGGCLKGNEIDSEMECRSSSNVWTPLRKMGEGECRIQDSVLINYQSCKKKDIRSYTIHDIYTDAHTQPEGRGKLGSGEGVVRIWKAFIAERKVESISESWRC